MDKSDTRTPETSRIIKKRQNKNQLCFEKEHVWYCTIQMAMGEVENPSIRVRPLKAKSLYATNKAILFQGWWVGNSHRYATHFIELQVEALNISDTSLDMHWTKNPHITATDKDKTTDPSCHTSNKTRSRISTHKSAPKRGAWNSLSTKSTSQNKIQH